MRASIAGFIFGATLPEIAGVYLLAHDIAYNASHPLGPNEGRCGMPMLGALAMIVFVGPLLGIVGAITAILGTMLLEMVGRHRAK